MDGSTISTIETPKKVRKGITGSTLKLVAIIIMLIDHTAATILDRTLMARGMGELNAGNPQAVLDFMSENAGIYYLDSFMRLIGRIAFPIFCFLLVEGFKYTHNKWSYAIRLGIFALVSEIPFDLALMNRFLEFSHQNVYFTLLIGLLVLIGFELVSEKLADKKWLPLLAAGGTVAVGCIVTYGFRGIIQFINIFLGAAQLGAGIALKDGVYIIIAIVITLLCLLIYLIMGRKGSFRKGSVLFADLLILVAGMLLAQLLRTDYSAFGILTIAVIYVLRKSNVKAVLGACITLTIMSLSELTAFFALIPAALYNGKRGWKMKYAFYIFYPGHLFLLYLICYFMGI
jgi:hypothetical protein